jgi:hypothetical protein
MEYIKKALKSKLVWLGIVQIVSALGMLCTGDTTLQEFLWGGSGIITIILRLITTQPIGNK